MFPQCKVDFVTKPQFKALLAACPELDTIYTLNGSVKALRKEIDFSQYDAVLDLHHNLRTRIFLRFLSGKVYRFPKNNLQKWLLTTFKIRPKNHTHVIERYLMPLFSYLKSKHIGQEPKFLVPDYARIDIKEAFNLAPKSYVAIAIGAQFATKRLPTDLLIELVKKINNPILENWATLILFVLLFFYIKLSFSTFLRMLLFSLICLVGNYYLSDIIPLLYASLAIFVVAWIGQFYGHKLEGKKPSFFKDLQFLLIGPAWVFEKISKK